MARKVPGEAAKTRKPAASKKSDAMGAQVARLTAALADGHLTTLGKLCAAESVPLTMPLAKQLATKVAVFGNPGGAKLDAIARMHVISSAQAARGIESDDVLIELLRRKSQAGKAKAHTLSDLKKLVPERLNKVFTERERAQRWPRGVGAIRTSRSVLVFLLEDVAGAGEWSTQPGSAPAATRAVEAPLGPVATAFAPAFDAAFDRLFQERRVNLVTLSALRGALPSFPRGDFDQGLDTLREQQRYVLQTFDGRHGQLSTEEDAAAIHEGGRRFVYVARREYD